MYKPNKEILAYGSYKANVVAFKATSNKGIAKEDNVLAIEAPINPWRSRLGHIGSKALNILPSKTLGVKDNFKSYNNDFKSCETCIKAKSTRIVNKEVSPKLTKYLDKVTIDIGGPIKPTSIRGYRYYITFLDDATGYLEVSLLKSRENTSVASKTFITRAENQSSNTLKRLHFDHEFKTKEIEELSLDKGIILTTSAPYTPEQKGSGERINRTLLEKVRALLLASNLALKYWSEALLSAVYLYNRTPHSSYGYNTPFELRFDQKPDVSNIKT